MSDELRYLEIAKEIGFDTSDPKVAADLFDMIRYMEAKQLHRDWNDQRCADELGLPFSALVRLKNTQVHRVATQIVLAMFMNNEARKTMQAKLFQIYQDTMPAVLLRLAQIATGKVLDDNGQLKTKQPGYQVQVQAATQYMSNNLADAFLANAFVGEQNGMAERQHLEMRQALLAKTGAIDLDTVDAEVIQRRQDTPSAPQDT